MTKQGMRVIALASRVIDERISERDLRDRPRAWSASFSKQASKKACMQQASGEESEREKNNSAAPRRTAPHMC
jgi:hypothetical protein